MRLLRPSNLNSEASSRGLAVQIMYYSVAALLPAVFSVLSSAIFTRIFSAETFGLYMVVVTLVSFLSSSLSQWLQQPINRYLPGMGNHYRYSFMKLIYRSLTLMCIGIVSVGLLALYYFNGPMLPYVVPATVYLCSQILYTVLGTVLQADLKARRYAYLQGLSSTLTFALSVMITTRLLKSPVSLIWAIDVAQITVIPLLYLSGASVSKVSSSLDCRRTDSLSKLLSYGMPMMGYFIATNVLGISDRFIVEAFRGSTEVGIYAANYNLVSGGVGLITGPIIAAAHPFLMMAWATRDENQTARWLGEIASNILALGSVAVGGIWLMAPYFARLFLGTNFRVGSNIMPIVLAGLVAMSFATYAHKPFEFKERTSLMMILAIFTAITNLVLNFFFVPRFGYVAAAWTTLVSYFLYALLTVVIGQRLMPWHISWRYIGTVLLCVMTSLGAAKWLLHVLRGESFWLTFCVVSIVYLTISLVPVVLVNRGLTRPKNDRDTVLETYPS